MTKRQLQGMRKRRLSVAEVLEPRVLYSADALGGLLPVFLPDESDDQVDTLTLLSTDMSALPSITDSIEAETLLDIKHVVFVDTSIAESEQIIASIDDEFTQVVVIDAGDNGLLEISKALSAYSDLDSVQLISHGESGQLNLGTTILDHETLLKNRAAIEQWGQALAADGDLLLLGCDVASGVEGREFVELLAQLSDADVAASTNLTGHVELGADWELEYVSGIVLNDHVIDRATQQQWSFSLGTITVDTTADQFDIPLGTTLAQLLTLQLGGEQVSLREAVYAASQGPASLDTINLDFGTYQLSRLGTDDIGLIGDLDSYDDIEIIGQGSANTTIVGAGNNTRIIEVNSGTARFEGLRMTGGDDDGDGGAIYGDAGTTITIVDSLLTGNQSDRFGGAVYSQGMLFIENSAISGNTANDEGGGVYSQGSVTIIDSTVFNNTAADSGGGVRANSVVIEGSEFSGNISGYRGGAVYAVSSISADSFSFIDNQADDNGGAIFTFGSFNVSNGEFTRNDSIDESGGAIYGWGAGTVDAVQFNDSYADGFGAAIYAEQSLAVTNSTFENNNADNDGGALYTEADLTVENSAFTGNSTQGDGGAVYARDSVSVNRSSFVLNTASDGSGGAISHRNSGVLSISNTTFSENSADRAGAILAARAGAIDNSTFAGNTANSNASAIVSTGANVSLRASIFQGNEISGSTATTVSSNVITEGWNIFDFNVFSTNRTDLENTQAQLGSLTNYGEGVSVYPLLPSSPAINSGYLDPLITTDSLNKPHDEFPDIGAFEYDGNNAVLFWGDAQGNLYSSNLEFTNIQRINFDVGNAPGSVAVDLENSEVYWLRSGSTELVSKNGDGSGVVSSFLTGLVDATSIAIDSAAAHIYIAHAGASARIDRYDLNSGLLLQSIVTTNIAQPVDIEINNETGRIFWAEQGGGPVAASIRSTDLNGNDFINHQNATNPTSIAINNPGNEIFWGDSALDTLNRLDLDTNIPVGYVIAPDNDPGALIHDPTSDQVAWASDTTDTITVADAALTADNDNYSHGDALTAIAITPTSYISAAPDPTTLNTINVAEGATEIISAAYLTSTDSDTEPTDIEYTIVSGLDHGFLIVDGVSNVTTFTQQQINDGLVEYSHDASEESSDQFGFVVSDGWQVSAPFVFNVSITPENDAPTLTVSVVPVDVLEGGSRVLTTLDLVANDVDNPTSDYVYRLAANSTLSTLEVAGLEIGVGGTFTHAQLVGGQVVYRHGGGEINSDSLEFSLSDGDADSANVALDITITPENDAPTLSSIGVPIAVVEGGSIVLTTADLIANDVDNPTSDYVYRLATSSTLSTLEVAGLEVGVGGTFTHAQLVGGQVVYRHGGGEINSDSLEFSLSDGDADSANVALDITITPENDAPTLSSIGVPIAVLEGGSRVLTTADLIANDVDNPTSDYVYRLAANSTLSTLEVAGLEIGVGGTFTHAQLVGGQVVYRHGGGEINSDSLEFSLSDGDADSANVALEIAITPENDAPTLSSIGVPIAVVEGGSIALTTADLIANDVDNPTSDYVYRLATSSTLSTLEVAGLEVGVGGTFTHAQLVGGQVVYRHGGGEINSDSLEFSLSDGDADSANVALDITITPENDAPTLSSIGVPIAVLEGGSRVLTTADLIANDVDSPTSDYVYRLATSSTLSTLEVAGLEVGVGGTFTHAQLVTGQVIYHHGGNEESGDILEFLVSDGSSDSATVLLEFTITPDNDPPSLTIDVVPIEENVTGAVLGNVLSTDSDEGDSITLSVDDTRFDVQGGVLALVSTESIDFETEAEIPLTVSATDSAGLTTSEQVLVTVLDRNDIPVVVEEFSSEVGDGFRLPLTTFVDSDNDQLRYSATLESGGRLPAWLEFNPSNRAFSVTDASLVVAELPVRIIADDGRGGQTSLSMILRFDLPLAAAQPVQIAENIDLDEIIPPSINAVFAATSTPESFSSVETKKVEDKDQIKEEKIALTAEKVVDLQELIKPLPIFNALELAELTANAGNSQSGDTAAALQMNVDSLDLADLLNIPQSQISGNTEEFLNSLDKQQENADERSRLAQTLIGSSVGISSGLSVGYLIWLIRGGTLMGSVLSSLPAWRFVDPLPVLGSLVEDIDGDDESLSTMVDSENRSTHDTRDSEAESIAMEQSRPFNGENG